MDLIQENRKTKKFYTLGFLLSSLILIYLSLEVVIRFVYTHPSIPILGGIITGQNVHPPEFYVLLAKNQLIRTSIYLAGATALLSSMLILIKNKMYGWFLCVVSILVSLLVLELFARTYYPDEKFRRPNELFHHSLKPNSEGLSVNPEWRVHYHINLYGFRDDDVSNSNTNIIALGDSFTEGFGVESEDNFVNVAEKRLRSKEKQFRMINTGVLSYSPSIEFLLLKHINETWRMQFSGVVLFLDIGDLQDDFKYEEIGKFDAHGNLIRIPSEPIFLNRRQEEQIQESLSKSDLSLSRLLERDFDRLRIAKIIRSLSKDQSSGYIPAVGDRGDIRYDRFGFCRKGVDWSSHFERTVKYLHEIHVYLQDRKKKFMLVVYPWVWDVKRKEFDQGQYSKLYDLESTHDDYFFSYFKEFAKKEGILFLDLRPALQEAHKKYPERELYFKVDPHFTVEGHRVVGETVANFLVKEGWL